MALYPCLERTTSEPQRRKCPAGYARYRVNE